MKRVIAAGVAAFIAVGCAANAAPIANVTTPAPTVTPEPTQEIVPPSGWTETTEPVDPAAPTEPAEIDESVADAGATPLGQSVRVGDWDLKIVKVNWNAAKALKRANQYNEPIPKGHTAVMVWVEGTYRGDGRETLDTSFMLRSVGQSGIEYSSFEDPTCGVLPDPDAAYSTVTVRKGATVKGWGACWVVDSDDVASLSAFAAPFLGDSLLEFDLR